ncbi:MAG: HNH endonuclease [Desulfobacterales bacterium]|nr:HNH endonuclease [Desulfobacterales bacterium]
MPGMPDRCWEWMGSLWRKGGYGGIKIEKKSITAHRYAWELHYGLIPPHLIIHHLCENTVCVNPRHLCLVAAKAHPTAHSIVRRCCYKGHPYDEENPLIDGKGYRRCRICAAESRSRYNAKKSKR